MHPITTADSLDLKLASHTLSKLEHIGFAQEIACYTSNYKSNAKRAIPISKTAKILIVSTWHNFMKECS